MAGEGGNARHGKAGRASFLIGTVKRPYWEREEPGNRSERDLGSTCLLRTVRHLISNHLRSTCSRYSGTPIQHLTTNLIPSCPYLQGYSTVLVLTSSPPPHRKDSFTVVCCSRITRYPLRTRDLNIIYLISRYRSDLQCSRSIEITLLQDVHVNPPCAAMVSNTRETRSLSDRQVGAVVVVVARSRWRKSNSDDQPLSFLQDLDGSIDWLARYCEVWSTCPDSSRYSAGWLVNGIHFGELNNREHISRIITIQYRYRGCCVGYTPYSVCIWCVYCPR